MNLSSLLPSIFIKRSNTACVAFALLLAGCGSGVRLSTSSQPATVKISGVVHGGQQVVTGSTIQLYAVGTGGLKSAATPLLTSTVITDGGGSFSLTGLYSCPSSTTNVYIVTTGGNPGLSSGQTNSTISMMSALGHCGDLTANSFISINEVTTVAAVYALAPYMGSYATLGAGPNDAALIDTAFATAAELANSGTGVSPGSNVVAGHTVQVSKLQTLADILSTCVNTTGGVAGDSTPCGALFSYTTSNVVPTDTIGALLNIALNPGQNVSSIFHLNPAVGPFQPSLHSAPADWNLDLTPSTTALAITSAILPPSTAGLPYAGQLLAAGGTPSYTWRVASGQLPVGLTLQPTTGQITGMPIMEGTSNFTVAVLDASNPTQVVSTPLSIVTISPLAITSSPLPAGTAGTAYAATLQASGGMPAYTWSISSGSLPAGLSLAATTGVISGTPSASGTSTFTIAVSDSALGTKVSTALMSITVVAAPVVPVNQGTTWYVRPDGGTRYSKNMTSGQCDGLGDAPYSGSGVNQHCAFKDVRYLWQDGSYTTDASQAAFPAYGWIGAGGDTYLLRGSIASGVSYRVGWNNPDSSYDAATGQFWGVQGNPYAGAPTPLAGTASQHTRILGENYGSCHSTSARTQLHGGYGVAFVLNMAGASYVDVACVDITDFSSCGRANQTQGCYPPADFASNGILWSNTATHDTLTDVRIHGMASAGMLGPTGDGTVMSYLDLVGNPSSGWNADTGDGLTGTGSLLVEHFNISWNGCAEEYPIVDALPYGDCTDQNSGGYGDGFGTSTAVSSPAWVAHFDQGVAAYNTQDGLDSLHLIGTGSSMTITRVLAYGNMGQQIKVGGASGTATNNVIVGNCFAMSQAIPGTPSDYNAHLSLFCRASNNAVFLSTSKGAKTTFTFNTIISAGAIGVGIACDQYNGACDQTALVDYRNNIFVGYVDNAANGDPNGSQSYPSAIYQCVNDGDCGSQQTLHYNVFSNPGSSFANNVTSGGKNPCPAAYETNAICGSPQLVDQSWHLYGYGDMTPLSTSVVRGSGVTLSSVSQDINGVTRGIPPTIGAIE